MEINLNVEPPKGSQLNSKIDWDALRTQSLRPGGFGANRRDIWPKLLNVKVSSSASPPQAIDDSITTGGSEEGLEPVDDLEIGKDALSRGTETLGSNFTKEHKDEHQIRLDTDRSFVLYPDDSKTRVPRSSLKSDLNRLIVSIFRSRPKLNYFQGYHDVLTVVYLTLPHELQFAFAEKLSLHRLRDSMLHSLEPVLGLLRILKNVLRLADPEFAKLLERDSPLPFYALSNLLTLFSHDMPTLPLIQHVFDYLFCRPPIAVVYLAAAMLLARRDYIQSVEDQLEPFMLHPVLSSLPPLTEGYEQEPSILLKVEDTSDIEQEPEVLLGPEQDSAEMKRDPYYSGGANTNTNTNTNTTKANTKIEPSSMDFALVKQEPLDSSSALGGPSRPPTPTPPRSPPSPPIKLKPEADFDSGPTSLSSSLNAAGLPIPRTPPIPLPAILLQADSIYAQYPPSHPSLRLSSIMGPQSVVFTWSENVMDLPSDATAEAMVGRPELVVYPVSPEEMEGSEEGEEEEETEAGGGGSESSDDNKDEKRRGAKGGKKRKSGGVLQRRRRRKKTIRKKVGKLLNSMFGVGGAATAAATAAGTQITRVDGRTMVAGAVLVLGVAMAVYGIKAHSGVGDVVLGSSVEDSIGIGLGAGLHMLGDGHRHEHLHDELKKVASVLVGVGAKFLNLGGG